MREVVFRRLRLCEKEGEPYPDLILVDGGRAQLNYSCSALSKKGMLGTMNIISLAKREEEIYTPQTKETIRLPKHSRVLHLLQYVRDESHRFALTFQRSKRKIS
jgi:excinuclease ABC subunit C